MNKVVLAFAAIAAFAISARAEFAPGWTATAMNASGTTIRPEGELVYAWMGGAPDYNTITTNVVNGVKFSTLKSLNNRPGSLTTMPFSFSPDLQYDGNGYGDKGVASAAYGTMLANGWWQNSAKHYSCQLKGLENGERYMVQLVFHNENYSSTVTAPDGTTFVKAKGTDWTYGGTLVGVFDATNAVYEFAIDFGDTPGFANAIQVRKVTGCEPVDDDTWFLGNIGGSAYDGEWNVPESGVTLDETKYVLEEPADPLEFSATEKRQVSAVQQITFETSAKFVGSYDELPSIDPLAKAGVVVANGNYYVLGKDTTTNAWFDTGITASLDADVGVSVNITNGTDGVHALYKFGESVTIDKVVVASGSWGDVTYKGSGEVARLAGVFEDFPWPMPGGCSVLVDPDWAEANNITVDDFASADKLGNGFSASESYVLGLNTNEALKITWQREEFVDTSESPSQTYTYFCIAHTNSVVKAPDLVTWRVYTNEASMAESAEFPMRLFERRNFNTSGAELVVQLEPLVSGQTDNPGHSDKLAVRCSQSMNHSEICYLAIPYECEVGTFLANLWDEEKDDAFYVYSAESNKWDTWCWSGGIYGRWDFIPEPDQTAPYTTTLHPGQAVKMKVVASDNPSSTWKRFYIVGKPVDPTKTAVVADKFNLVGSPNGADFQLSNLENGSRIMIVDPVTTNKLSVYALPNAMYYQNSKEEWLYRVGYTGAGTPATSVTNATGTASGFFLLPKSNVINW